MPKQLDDHDRHAAADRLVSLLVRGHHELAEIGNHHRQDEPENSTAILRGQFDRIRRFA